MGESIIEEWLGGFQNKRTRYQYKSMLKKYFNFLDVEPEKYLKDKNRNYESDMKRYNVYLNEHLSPTSIPIRISAVKEFLEDHDILIRPRIFKQISRRNPVPEPVSEDRIPTTSELKQILTHGDARSKSFFLVMISSGIRPEELCQIETSMIDFDSNPSSIKIPGSISKTKRQRFTFISTEAKESLMEWLKVKDAYQKAKVGKSQGLRRWMLKNKGVDFVHPSSKRIFPFTTTIARTAWNRMLKKSGLDEKDKSSNRYVLHLYVLRKFANTKLKNVCNRDMVESWMGHQGIYDKWNFQEHQAEYVKGMEQVLVFSTPANLEEMEKLKEKIQQHKIEREDLKADINELKKNQDTISERELMMIKLLRSQLYKDMAKMSKEDEEYLDLEKLALEYSELIRESDKKGRKKLPPK